MNLITRYVSTCLKYSATLQHELSIENLLTHLFSQDLRFDLKDLGFEKNGD